MSDDLSSPFSEVQDPELARLGAAPGKDLSPAARRALEEAAARRDAEAVAALPTEKGGRDGPEPTRFGDWERKGVAVDF
ncbi:DUF1674 domain-containing protein [Caulobacter radicis]|uniref:DUF1674 domain-containing protein n=1 Tax=Caulobacter radicis TaxID=2172650 RepID=A0A2T9J1J6_9CAUL|nr:DUF1674 domain-containing protein [Caulobacter radicis]PVM73960.1 DUF1674 domain-containing protein [Caulobacter radicis]